MTVYVATDAKVPRVGCDVVESVEDYMEFNDDVMFVDSDTCDTSKGQNGGTTAPLSPRNAGATAGKVIGAFAALAVATAGMFACRQSQQKRSEQERANDVEYIAYHNKLQDDSFDTNSFSSTQDGSMINNRTMPESPVRVTALDPIGEGPDEPKFCPCPIPFDETGENTKACLEQCCGVDAAEEVQANVAACAAAAATCCAADDIKENFQVAGEHAEAAAGEVADHIKEAIEDDVMLVEENATQNVVDLGDDMGEDAAAFPGYAAEAGVAAVAAIGAGAVAVAAAVEASFEVDDASVGTQVTQDVDGSFEVDGGDSFEEDAHDARDASDLLPVPPPPPRRKPEESSRSECADTLDENVDEETLQPVVDMDMEEEPLTQASKCDESNTRSKEEVRESALENIDEALKGSNWVGVLNVANEMSREEDTDATDSDEEQQVTDCDEEQQVTDCGINAEQLGEINDSIVAVGSLIDEGEFAPADEEAPVPASVDAPAMDDEEEVF
jgi:hypothetical protein